MTKKFFSGNSVEQAVLTAARHFQLEPQEVDYRPVERRHGFLRGRRRAVIAVDADSPRKEAEATDELQESLAVDEVVSTPPPASVVEAEAEAESWHTELEVRPDPGSETEPASEAPTSMAVEEFWPEEADEVAEPDTARPATPQLEDELEAVDEALDRLLTLADLRLDADVRQGEERIEIELRGEDEDRLLEDRGRLLLAIQHLLPRMLRGLTGRSAPCWVDCDNFHEIRAEQLRDLAQQVASQVRRDRQMETLEPMSPDERRIVHVTLADDPAVETVSRGQGLFKRIQVRPVRSQSQPQGFDPYSR